MIVTHRNVIDALQDLALPENVAILQRFFKTGKGEYGEGDVFIGVKVPEQRNVAQAFFKEISLKELSHLLQSPIHEHRHTALFVLVAQYKRAKTLSQKEEIVSFYLNHKQHINNWDLVDASSPKILGPFVLETNNIQLLFQLANETHLWTKRIAVVAMWYLWKYDYKTEGLQLLSINISHPHDLMQKANGWMLRELGKIEEDLMLQYIEANYAILPRTTLRYAIEKIDPVYRKKILQGQF